MQVTTEKMMNEMIAAACGGQKIYPAFWQPRMGRSNTVSAAITAAKKAGALVEGGKDGNGRPYYVAPVKAATHTVSGRVQ